MSMISEQIQALRNVSMAYRSNGLGLILNDAANTIEKLSAKLASANMERSEQHYNDGWILCSERLPSEKGDYLVTCNDGKVRVWWFVVEKDFKCWLRGVNQLKPIAWQPLPQPYVKGE